VNDLPKEPFLIIGINGGSQHLPIRALEAFEGVYDVPVVTLTLADGTGLRHLRDVAIQKLTLSGMKINGDECLEFLGERPDLLQLTMSCSSISDTSVPLLLRMKRLRYLALPGCSNLTVAGIRTLASHPALGFVQIDPITPEAAVLLNQLPFVRYVYL